jgi:hypothetical protein
MRAVLLLLVLLFSTTLSAGVDGVKLHIAIIKQAPMWVGDTGMDDELAEAQLRARDVQNFWRHYAGHKWDIQVRGYAYRGVCFPEAPHFCRDEIFDADIDMGDFTPNVFHIWSRWGVAGRCGLAVLWGSWGLTYAGCPLQTTIHEVGHNIGLRHASAINRSGNGVDEYGDDTDIMGGNVHISGLAAPNVYKLRLKSLRGVYIVEDSEQVLIAPLELNESALRPKEQQVVIAHRLYKDNYFVSLRKARGTRYRTSSFTGNKLYIHRREDGNSVLVAELEPGDSIYLPNRISVEYVDYQDETAKVNFLYSGNDTIMDGLMPVGLPDADSAITVGPQHSGLWYNPLFNGQGLFVQRGAGSDGRGAALVYFFTFNEYTKAARFFWGFTDAENLSVEFPIYTTNGGSFDNPGFAKKSAAGVAQLSFSSDASALFRFNTFQHGRGSVELQPVALSSNPLNGSYYAKGKEGSGLTAQIFGGGAVVYWYTYGPAVLGPHGENSTQRWFLATGPKSGDGYDLTIYAVEGGRFLFCDDVETRVVGKAHLKLGDKPEFSYEIDSEAGIQGEDVLYLDRLF